MPETIQIYTSLMTRYQALLSVFKGRLVDVREKDTAVERCEVCIQDRPDKTERRLIVKMVCRHGTYLLSSATDMVLTAGPCHRRNQNI